MTPAPGSGIVSIASAHSVAATVQKLTVLLAEKGVKVFAVIDHSGEAARVGLTMRPTQVVVFGNPRAGTPIMVASPTAALDLPLKILVAEDAQGKVWISYDSPAYLRSRHAIPDELLQNIAVIETLATNLAR